MQAVVVGGAGGAGAGGGGAAAASSAAADDAADEADAQAAADAMAALMDPDRHSEVGSVASGDGDETIKLAPSAAAPLPRSSRDHSGGGLPGLAARWRRSLESQGGAPEALVAAAPAPLSPKAGADAYERAALAAVGTEPGAQHEPRAAVAAAAASATTTATTSRLARRFMGASVATDGSSSVAGGGQGGGGEGGGGKEAGGGGKGNGADGDDSAAKPPPTKKVVVPMSRLVRLNAPEWPYAAVGAVSSVVVGAVQPVFALVLASMINVFFDGPDLSKLPAAVQRALTTGAAATSAGAPASAAPLPPAALRRDTIMAESSKYALYFFAIGVVILASLAVQQVCFGKCGAELAQRVRLLLLSAVLRQEVAWFDRDEASPGRLASHLASDATHVRGAVADVLGVVMQNLGTLGLGYGLALYFDWRVALLVTAALPLLATSSLLHVKFTLGTSSSTEQHFADANAAVSEAVGAARTIQSFNLQREVAEEYDQKVAAAERQVLRAAVVGGAAMAFSYAMLFGIYAVVLAFGGWEIRSCLVDFDGFFKSFMCIVESSRFLMRGRPRAPSLARLSPAGANPRLTPPSPSLPPFPQNHHHHHQKPKTNNKSSSASWASRRPPWASRTCPKRATPSSASSPSSTAPAPPTPRATTSASSLGCLLRLLPHLRLQATRPMPWPSPTWRQTSRRLGSAATAWASCQTCAPLQA